MNSKLSYIGFRIFTTNDFLFGLLSQILLLLWKFVVAQALALQESDAQANYARWAGVLPSEGKGHTFESCRVVGLWKTG